MIPTPQMQRLIRDQLRENPLKGDEVRRVEGMGRLYVSLDRTHAEDCLFLYTFEIDGTEYHFFASKGESID